MKSIRINACLILAVLCAVGHAAEPELLWKYETRGKIYTSPILADLDSDGTPEIVVCASRDRRVLCLNGAGTMLWDYRIDTGENDGIQATPSAVDYDGDGKREVLFADCGGVVGCLGSGGQLIWRTFTGDHVDYSGPVVADINGDGRVEVVVGSDSGTVYCLDDCGMEMWHYQGDGQIRGVPAVEFDEAAGTYRVYVTFGGGGEACLSSDGDVLWSHNEPSPRKERRSGPAVGDLDGDGRAEVVSATDDFRVIVRDAMTGEEEWRWKGKHGIDQTNSFALADFGDGRLDIVCGDGSGLGGPGSVYRLRDGEALWTADVGGVVQGPSVGDVDGDGALEILVCTRSNRLVCLSAGGDIEWEYLCEAGALTTPAIGDVDGDGRVEIVFTSKDRFVYCLTAGGESNETLLPWPMLNHDPQLSGNAAGATFAAAAPSPPAETPEELSVERFGPLVVGDNRVRIAFANNSSRPRHLEAVAEVLRPDGTVVTNTDSRRYEPFEIARSEFTLPAYEEGRYTLSARLLDVGTGRTLATAEDAADFVPFAAERAEFEQRRADAQAMLAALEHADLKSRAAAAVERSATAVAKALKDAEGAATRERARYAGALAQTAGQHRRDMARLQAAATTPGATGFAVVPETTLRKVFRDEPYQPTPREARVELAANEAEGIQLVVVPLWKDLHDLRVTAGGLRQVDGNGTIPGDNIEILRVGYVPIGPPEYNFFVEKVGDYPDVLYPAAATDIAASQDAQPYFVVVHAPAQTPPGEYAGTITFSADGAADVELPLQVRVWSFALPEETSLKVSMWMNESFIQRFYGYESRTPFEVRKRYYDMHLAHRVSPVKDFPLNGGDMLEDFEYLIPRGQNCFFIPVPEYLEASERPARADKYRATRDLLVEKGWNDLAMFYTRDEVAVMARHMIPEVVEMNAWIKEVVPEWPRLQTSAPELALFDAVDIWCPTIDHFDPVVLQERMGKGDRLWFYTVWGRPGIMIEFPATDHRLMFWACWKYGAEGFLYWGTTHWDLNTVEDARWPDVPWITYNRQPGHNGCGYLLYPGPDGAPLSSIRLASVRDGIEDYEYFAQLRALVERVGSQAPAELRVQAQRLLAVDAGVMASHKQYTEDPDAILKARREIAETIEAYADLLSP